MSDMKDKVQESFKRYASGVIINRAVCDVRDMLKPSARMLLYSQKVTTKNTPDKPFVKSARIVGDALGHWYTHGDSSCYATYMRMAKPFAMRYPLEECQGNYGTVVMTGDEASSRYTEMRLSKIGNYLFNQIEKDTIDEWEDNFDETSKYPRILPSLGFYNIVNGTSGIGVSLSSNIPQFNLREINNSLIKLLWDEDTPFNEIVCMPDYATGGILLNAEEVKESLKNGYGAAAKLRAVIEYDNTEHCFIVKELPYGVYTSTITEQIQKMIENDPSCGITKINDGSGKTPNYYIYISKDTNPDTILKKLYKETSLQYFNTINMTVLEDGRFPKVFGLKEMLLQHIRHEKEVYIRGYKYDLNKIENRLHIIEGLIKAIADINEVIKIIKNSKNSATASIALQEHLLIDKEQAKAILDIKLSKLTNLEITKLTEEESSLLEQKENIIKILNDETLLKKIIEKGFIEVSNKFGDERRTKILNIENENDEPLEIKQIQLSLTNKNNIIINEISSLYTQKRGATGLKLPLEKNEYVMQSVNAFNNEKILFFTKDGKCYSSSINNIGLSKKISINTILSINSNVAAITPVDKNIDDKFVIFITKKGTVKKTPVSEFSSVTKKGVVSIKLNQDDEIVNTVIAKNSDKIGIMTKLGYLSIVKVSDFPVHKRNAKGVLGMKCASGDSIISTKTIEPNTTDIVFIDNCGYGKIVSIEEMQLQNRGAKGNKVFCSDEMRDFISVDNNTNNILIVTSISILKIKKDDINRSSKGAKGIRISKINNNTKIIALSKI